MAEAREQAKANPNPNPEAEAEDVGEGGSDELLDLVARIRAGDQDAIRTFVDRFEDEVRGMVRVRLPRRLRPRFDSMDFVQAVWQSFFARLNRDSKEFENSRHLRGFLAGVARNKVFEVDRRRTRTEKYAIAREEPLYVRRGDHEVARELPARDPSPSQNLQARDRLELLTAGRPEREAEILRLRRDGMTVDDIAARLEINEKTVRRVIEAARNRMEERRWE